MGWAVLPLVAGLFVLVEALDRTGVVNWLTRALADAIQSGAGHAAAIAATILAFGSNLTNNLPAGLVASSVIQQLKPPQTLVDGLLIGVDLGPNLSITGSLATILWLSALRREGIGVSFMQFLRVGLLVMPAALFFSLAARMLVVA